MRLINIRNFGYVVGLLSCLCNPWLLAYYVSPDRTIDSLVVNSLISAVQVIGFLIAAQCVYRSEQTLMFVKRYWKNVVLLVIVYGLCELTVVTTGVFLPKPNAERDRNFLEFSVPDTRLGYVMTPNLRGFTQTWLDEGVEGVYDTDARGFRNPGVHEATSSVFFIGDSFTFGSWVPREETFYARIGQAMKQSVVTYGVGGYGMSQYVVEARDIIPTTTIKKTLFINIFANDLEEPYPEEKLATLYYDVLVSQTSAMSFWERFSFRYTTVYQLAHLLFQRSAAYRMDSGLVLFANRGASQSFASHDRVAFERKLHTLLKTVRNRSDIAHVYIVLIPSKESTYQEAYREAFHTTYLENEAAGFDLVKIVAASYAIPTLDLTAIFRERARTEKLYFDLDPHWNAAGHALAANAIWEWLEQNKLLHNRQVK